MVSARVSYPCSATSSSYPFLFGSCVLFSFVCAFVFLSSFDFGNRYTVDRLFFWLMLSYFCFSWTMCAFRLGVPVAGVGQLASSVKIVRLRRPFETGRRLRMGASPADPAILEASRRAVTTGSEQERNCNVAG